MKVIFHSNLNLKGERHKWEAQINQTITAAQHKTQDRDALYKSIKHILEHDSKSFMQKVKEKFGGTQITEQPFTGVRFTDVRAPSTPMVAYFESAYHAQMAANLLTFHLGKGTRFLEIKFPPCVWVMEENQEQIGNE